MIRKFKFFQLLTRLNLVVLGIYVPYILTTLIHEDSFMVYLFVAVGLTVLHLLLCLLQQENIKSPADKWASIGIIVFGIYNLIYGLLSLFLWTGIVFSDGWPRDEYTMKWAFYHSLIFYGLTVAVNSMLSIRYWEDVKGEADRYKK